MPEPYLPLVYLPEVDGLRAIAVLAVVFYHAGLSCPGGFVGVDIFFVISGYLITALLLRELTGPPEAFSLAKFWERRVRRIFPACAAMVLVTLVAGAFLPWASDYAKLGWSSVAQSAMVANLFFWNQTGGYFADNGVLPLLHTWSLAVEEQFYLFFPLLLLALRVKVVRQRPAVLRSLLWLGLGVSLAMAAVLLPTKEKAVFYFLPTRAWELLCGASLAAIPVGWLSPRPWLREGVAWLGLAAVMLPIWLYSQLTPFPGLAALPPCLGAVAIIWANLRHPHTPRSSGAPTAVGRLLALRPVVAIGLISYSLYLWHWPLLVFWHYGWVDLSGLPVAARWWPVALALGLAAVSWRWIELPFREKRLAPNRRTIFRFALAVTAVELLMGATVAAFHGFPSRLPEAVKKIAAQQVPGNMVELKTEEIVAGRIPRFGRESDTSPVKWLLWGDSHAWVAMGAMDEIFRRQGITGEVVTYGSTPPVLGAVFGRSGLRKHSAAWADAVFAHIQRKEIREVVLAARWAFYEQEDARLLETALTETIRRLQAEGCRVWVVQDVPTLAAYPVRMQAREAMWGTRADWRPTQAEHHEKNSVLYRLAAQKSAATFIDPAPSLRVAGSDRYEVERDGIHLYQDNHHLSPRGAQIVFVPLLSDAFDDGTARVLSSAAGPRP